MPRTWAPSWGSSAGIVSHMGQPPTDGTPLDLSRNMSQVLESIASYATRAEEIFHKITNPWSLDTFVQSHKNKLLEKQNVIMQNVNPLTTLWMLQQYRMAIRIPKCSFSVSVPVSSQLTSKQFTGHVLNGTGLDLGYSECGSRTQGISTTQELLKMQGPRPHSRSTESESAFA